MQDLIELFTLIADTLRDFGRRKKEKEDLKVAAEFPDIIVETVENNFGHIAFGTSKDYMTADYVLGDLLNGQSAPFVTQVCNLDFTSSNARGAFAGFTALERAWNLFTERG